MKVLVTGATGFIGSHLCRALLQGGDTVRAAFLPGDDRSRLNALAREAETVEVDLFHASDSGLAAAVDGVDTCIHCAWYAVPGRYLMAQENIDCLHGTLRLIKALGARGCSRIVGVGTCFEYAPAAHPMDETTPLQPATLYAAAKVSAFLMGQQLAGVAGMSFAWARLFYLYGPFEDPRRLVPAVAMRLLREERAAVTAGTQVRDFMHVEDVASALAAVAHSGLDGAVNVGSGQPVTVRRVVETIANATGRPDLIDWGAHTGNLTDPPHVVADNRRLREQVGWVPRYDLDEGLRRAVAWWREV